MTEFNKKDKRYNNYQDNYLNRYRDSIFSGLVMLLIIGAVYGVYKLVEYLFL